MSSFYDLYGDKSLRRLFADWKPAPLGPDDADWLHFPPEMFLGWARAFPRYSFDGIPPSPSHKRSTNFLLSQTHRIWLSCKLIVDHFGLEGSLVDFGSYPYSVPLTLRDYFKYRGLITSTSIQSLPAEERAILDGYGIRVEMLDLDPYVVDRARQSQPPPNLALEPGSVDLVTMFHVIEHLYHPMSSLREAQRILKPGGSLLIGTDNAMMLRALQHYISGYGYTFEPVVGTAAMTVNDWRGHVRFFTPLDLQTMAEAAGFQITEVGFEEVFYDVFHEEYFVDPTPYTAGSTKAILKQHRQFANDQYLIAVKL